MSNSKPPDGGSLRSQPETMDTHRTTSTDTNQQKNRHYFISYLAAKRRIANILRQNKEKKAWLYTNTAKLINPKRIQFDSKDIFHNLKSQLSIDPSKIKQITLTRSKKVWLIELNDATEFSKLVEKNLTIKDNTFNLIDANIKPEASSSVTLKAIYRIHWLPPNFNKNHIKEYLENRFSNTKIVITQIENEHFQGEMSHIENGVIRVKIEYPLEDNDYVISAIGRAEIDSIKALIQLNGYPPRCRYCDGFEHPAKECPKSKLKCTKCNGRFHSETQCTLALRIKQTLNQNNDDSDEEEEPEDDDMINEEVEQENNEKHVNTLNENNITNIENQYNSILNEPEKIITSNNLNKTNLKHSASLNNLNTITFAIPNPPINLKSIKPNQAKTINEIKTVSSAKREVDRTSLDNTQTINIRQRPRTDKIDQVVNLIESADTVTPKPNHPLVVEQQALIASNKTEVNSKGKNTSIQMDKPASKTKGRRETKNKSLNNE